MRPYINGDEDDILDDMRQEQVNECLALGATPRDALMHAISLCEAQTLEIKGKVAGIFGVVDRGTHLEPWSVFNSRICESPITFLRECKRWVSGYDRPMLNAVIASDEVAVRWLEWMGFNIDPPTAEGHHGELFRWYWR